MTLLRQERGAIMLLGLFMAVFLTAALYYAIGIGESVLQRERMQDAADAAAFSAAVVHARGMNLLALINMVMAALLAVLVALKLLETLMTIGLVIVMIASFFSAGSLSGLIPQIAKARQEVRDVHDSLQEPIDAALKALHIAGQGVRTAVPTASELRVVDTVVSHYRPPASRGIAVLPGMSLPTEDGTFSQLCDKAGSYVGDVVADILDPAIPGDFVEPRIQEAVADLTSAGADWFCGTNGSKPPKATVSQKLVYPRLPSIVACEGVDPSSPGYDAHEHERLCAIADAEGVASKPDETTGECTASDCGSHSAYERRAALAQEECAPRKRKDGRLHGFQWQERQVTRVYRWHAKRGWQIVEEEIGTPVFKKGSDRPCGTRALGKVRGWNGDHFSDDGSLLPVCSTEEPLDWVGGKGETHVVAFTEVLRVFGCQEKIKRTYELSDEAQKSHVSESSASEQNKKVPQLLLPGVRLGEKDFQLRAVVFGRPLPPGPEGVLDVAAWGAGPEYAAEAKAWNAVRQLGQLSIAQAEFYYAVENPEIPETAEFMWNMRWQARLRRFRIPEAQSSNGNAVQPLQLREACKNFEPEGTNICDALDPSLSNLIVH